MKKKIAIVGLFVLLAAGCNSTQTATPANQQQVITETQNAEVKPSAEASKVSGVDDAVKLLEAHSSSEQSITTGSDDSDLAASDTQELNSLMEVPNE